LPALNNAKPIPLSSAIGEPVVKPWWGVVERSGQMLPALLDVLCDKETVAPSPCDPQWESAAADFSPARRPPPFGPISYGGPISDVHGEGGGLRHPEHTAFTVAGEVHCPNTSNSGLHELHWEVAEPDPPAPVIRSRQCGRPPPGFRSSPRRCPPGSGVRQGCRPGVAVGVEMISGVGCRLAGSIGRASARPYG
jgi:hypothetical protein